MKIRVKTFITDLVIGAAIAAGVCYLNYSRGYGALRCVCDGFFVAAVLLLGIGVIMLARNKGTFDLAGFGLSTAFFTAFPGLRQGEKEDITEYIERKRETRRSSAEFLLSGLLFLVLAIVTLIIYEVI